MKYGNPGPEQHVLDESIDQSTHGQASCFEAKPFKSDNLGHSTQKACPFLGQPYCPAVRSVLFVRPAPPPLKKTTTFNFNQNQKTDKIEPIYIYISPYIDQCNPQKPFKYHMSRTWHHEINNNNIKNPRKASLAQQLTPTM